MTDLPAYRFSEPTDHLSQYRTGELHPHRLQYIERRTEAGEWERIGYVEIHTHKVKLDETDIEDVSVGVTVRINPKAEQR